MTRTRPPSHVHMVLLHTGECHLDYVFSDLIRKVMEVFMDDFYIYRKTFKDYLANLDKVLKRCQMVDLVLN
jgi:hypothetical protein